MLGCRSVARLLSFGLNVPGFGKQPSGHMKNIVQTSALQKHFVYSVLQNLSYLQTVLIRIMKVIGCRCRCSLFGFNFLQQEYSKRKMARAMFCESIQGFIKKVQVTEIGRRIPSNPHGGEFLCNACSMLKGHRECVENNNLLFS